MVTMKRMYILDGDKRPASEHCKWFGFAGFAAALLILVL